MDPGFFALLLSTPRSRHQLAQLIPAARDLPAPRYIDAFVDAERTVLAFYLDAELPVERRLALAATCGAGLVDATSPDVTWAALGRLMTTPHRIVGERRLAHLVKRLDEAGSLPPTNLAVTPAQRTAHGTSPPPRPGWSPQTAKASTVPPSPSPNRVPPRSEGADLRPASTANHTVTAQVMRNGRWRAVRLRQLTMTQATLAAGNALRAGDRVHLGVSVGDHTALLRGIVVNGATAQELATSGTATATVQLELSEGSAADLHGLLAFAATHGVSFQKPPARAATRLAVSWPIRLGTNEGPVDGEALDISEGGFFVQTQGRLQLRSLVQFQMQLDDGGAIIRGQGRVVRRIDAGGEARGVHAGFGIVVQGISADGKDRWQRFVERVRKRSQRRVVIGASGDIAKALAERLAATGYCVVAGANQRTIAALTESDMPSPDAVILDASLGSIEARALDTLFRVRNVPRLATRGDVAQTQRALDQLMQV